MKHGSMRHYPSGRKKSYNAWTSKKREYEFTELVTTQPYRRETPEYKSLPMTGTRDIYEREDFDRVEESKNFTVAPAYNKGAYQVISRENVKHIGK